MEECNIAKKFDHPNVLSLLGISFTPEENKPLMVMPYMHHGDVKSYLKSKRGGVAKIEELSQVWWLTCIGDVNGGLIGFGCFLCHSIQYF